MLAFSNVHKPPGWFSVPGYQSGHIECSWAQVDHEVKKVRNQRLDTHHFSL